MIKKWYGLARILPKCYLKLLHPFVCYSLSKDRCSAWKLPICCFDSIRAFDYRNYSHIALYPSYIIFEHMWGWFGSLKDSFFYCITNNNPIWHEPYHNFNTLSIHRGLLCPLEIVQLNSCSAGSQCNTWCNLFILQTEILTIHWIL